MKQEDLVLAKDKIAVGFRNLSSATNELKSAADQLSLTISELEKVLKSLNLRVAAWHRMSRSMEDSKVRCRYVGYAHVGGKWGIALRKTLEDPKTNELLEEEIWRFSDGPLWMCADAVSNLPELIQALTSRTQETTARIRSKNLQAKEIVSATAGIAVQNGPSTGGRK